MFVVGWIGWMGWACRLMGVAIKRKVPVVCCAETQADAEADFAFDHGEPTLVKGRSVPIKVSYLIGCGSVLMCAPAGAPRSSL